MSTRSDTESTISGRHMQLFLTVANVCSPIAFENTVLPTEQSYVLLPAKGQ
jgi:hypothetical protein